MIYDLWSYDPDSRRVIDENGLSVAQDVNPDDGARIVSMMSGLIELASDGTQPRPAHAVTAMQALTGNLADVGEVPGVQPERSPTDPAPLWAILADMLAYEAEEFDAEPDEDGELLDLDLSGAREEAECSRLSAAQAALDGRLARLAA